MSLLLYRCRSWFRKFDWLRAGVDGLIPLDHGLYPESYFREKLMQEKRRAVRSNKPLVIMVLDAEHIRRLDTNLDIAELLCEGVSSCIRSTDTCGLLKEGTLVGVILTEVEAEKVETAKRVIEKKTRETLSEVLSDEAVSQITVSFLTYPEIGASESFDARLSSEHRTASGAHTSGR